MEVFLLDLYDFVAIDFETATRRYDSACSVGIVAVKDGIISDTYYTLLQPPDLKFDAETISIHGITPEMVKDAPSFLDIWPNIRHFFGPHLIVAHNARFDMLVLKNTLDWMPVDDFHYVDSVSIAKSFVPGSKSLAHCAEHFSIDMGMHHNAMDDATVCAKIVQRCLQASDAKNIGQLCFSKPNIKIHQFSDLPDNESAFSTHKNTSGTSIKKYPHTNVRVSDIVPCSSAFDCSHPLYQKRIVFTGELSMDRASAMQMAADVGACVKSSVSGKTDFLVVGKQDTSLVGDDGMSTKEEKAYQLNQSGKGHIQIISEQEFISLVHTVEV